MSATCASVAQSRSPCIQDRSASAAQGCCGGCFRNQPPRSRMPTRRSSVLSSLFARPTGVLLGVVHLGPLPGAPGAGSRPARRVLDDVLESALADLRALESGSLDGAIVENFGDAPFFAERVPAATIAAMTAIAVELR